MDDLKPEEIRWVAPHEPAPLTEDEVGPALQMWFPHVFTKATPLARTVAVALQWWAFERDVPSVWVRDWVFSWVRKPEYLAKILAGGDRFDIRGRPVEKISERDRCYSLEFLCDIDRRLAAREAASSLPKENSDGS